MHPATFKIIEIAPAALAAPSFSLFMNSASIYCTQHPAFKNGTMLPFAHPLLFSLRWAVLPRILFVSLRSIWFSERLGFVKVKVKKKVSAIVVVVQWKKRKEVEKEESKLERYFRLPFRNGYFFFLCLICLFAFVYLIFFIFVLFIFNIFIKFFDYLF